MHLNICRQANKRQINVRRDAAVFQRTSGKYLADYSKILEKVKMEDSGAESHVVLQSSTRSKENLEDRSQTTSFSKTLKDAIEAQGDVKIMTQR